MNQSRTKNSTTKNLLATLSLSLFSIILCFALSRSLRPPWSWKNICYNNRNVLFPEYYNMDSNTYTRSLELPIEQMHAKPPKGTTTDSSGNFTILQPPYFNGHERSIFTFFRRELVCLVHRRRIHTLCCTSLFTEN